MTKTPKEGNESGAAAPSATRQAVTDLLHLTADDEALLARGFEAVIRARHEDPKKREALIREAARRDSGREVLLAYYDYKDLPDAEEMLEEAAKKNPQAAAKGLVAYLKSPSAEKIFKNACKTSGEDAGGHVTTMILRNTDLIETHPWLQPLYLLQTMKTPASIVQDAKRFGGRPWFAPALEALPGLIRAASDPRREVEWTQMILKEHVKRFPPGVVAKIQAKLAEVSPAA